MNDLTPERIEEYERTADEILRMAPLDRAPVGQWPQRVKDLAAALREAQAALNEVGPLMEAAITRPLWGSLQGDWRERALAWHAKHNATLRDVAALAVSPPADEASEHENGCPLADPAAVGECVCGSYVEPDR